MKMDSLLWGRATFLKDFFNGAYGQNVALGELNAEIGLTSATTTLLLFCVYHMMILGLLWKFATLIWDNKAFIY